MCGIYAAIGEPKTAAQSVFKGLKDIEYRGYDSWGVACFENSELKVIKEKGFLPTTLQTPNTHLSIGHTRWATHGGVTRENAHPHTDCQGKLVLVHNGIVENFLELKKQLKNHEFRSQTDSEVIVHTIEDQLKKSGTLLQAVSVVFNKLEGLNAVVVTDGEEIVAVKKGSPLVVGKTIDSFVLASDPNAILPQTKDLLFLEDNQVVKLNHRAELYNVKNLKKLPYRFTKVEWDYASANLKNYPHYMLKEIHEQPQVIKEVLANSAQAQLLSEQIKKAFGTFFIACGTASYACLLGTYLFAKYAKKHVNFAIGSEFNYLEDFLTNKSLLVAVSQSGESIDTLEPLLAAKKKGAKIASLVNVLGSSIYRASDYPLLLNAGVEKAVASTKAMISMISYMILLSFMVAGKKAEAEKILKDSAKETERILTKSSEIKRLTENLSKASNLYILGRGLSYAVALEATLKIKEISYIHAEGFAGGELKHGPIALIEKGTPVIVFAPNDETYKASISNAMEVKARGAYVVGVGYKNNPVFDYFFEVKDVGASSVIPHIVFAQLLSYYLTVKKGLNPDKPRNLAKSVVVR